MVPSFSNIFSKQIVISVGLFQMEGVCLWSLHSPIYLVNK